MEMVDHLLALSETSKSPKEFSGFDVPSTSTITPMEEDSRVPEVVTPPVPVPPPAKLVFPPSKAAKREDASTSKPKKNSHLMESDVKMVVEQVVTQLAPIIRTFCVTERMVQIQQESDDWKSLVALLMKNPKLTVSNWDPKVTTSLDQKEIRKAIAFPHPCEQTWEQFMASPLSTPVWTVILKLDLVPTADIFTKWWKKIKSDTRFDAWKKLSRYLQCIRYFNQASDDFWAQMSTNPTYWSLQKISVNLAIQANWLKAAGLDLKDIQLRYLEAASAVAQGEPKVSEVLKVLDGLWPANFKPVNLHYDGEPFKDTILYAQDTSTLCVKTAKPKGLRVPDSLFNPLNDSVDDENSVDNMVSVLSVCQGNNVGLRFSQN